MKISEAPKNCIRTFTGKFVNLLDPDPDTIVIEDIIHALSLINRWNGHSKFPISVCTHSVLCADLAPEPHKFATLMHDSSEAYLSDISSPLKALLPDYKIIEDRFMKVISKKYGFQYPFHEEVHIADRKMLNTEWDEVMINLGIKEFLVWSPEYSRDMFKLAFINQFVKV